MFLAKVVGNVVSTHKNPGFQGMKLLLIQPHIKKGQELVPSGSSIVRTTVPAPGDTVVGGMATTVPW